MDEQGPIAFFGRRAGGLADRLAGWFAAPCETVDDPAALAARLAEDWTIAAAVIDLAEHDHALLQRLAAQRRPVLIAIVDAESADVAGMLDSGPPIEFVAPDAPAAELIAVLMRALSRAEGGQVAELSERSHARVERFARDAEQIDAALASMAADPQRRSAPSVPPPEPGYIRAVVKARRARERHFPAELFSDPAWDMLLDLSAARLDGRKVSVSSLCIAAAVPTTTALRWIRNLCDAGLFEREIDPHDARRAFIGLSEPTFAAMLSCVATLRATLSNAAS